MHYNLSFDFFPSQFFSTVYVASSNRADVKKSMRAPLHAPKQESARVSYESLVSETRARMCTRKAIAESIAESCASRESNNGKMALRAQEWTLQIEGRPIANLRMVHIQGAKNEIINTWIFPNRPRQMPVFAAELIAVGNSTKVAFVDIQVPVVSDTVADDVASITSSLEPRFSCLPCDEAAPEWATHDSQGHFTYARDVPDTKSHVIEACYLSYLDGYLDAFTSDDVAMSIAHSDRDESAITALHEYQVHHMKHSPGNKFLSKLFGSDWTEAFMTDFLFAKPRG